MTARKTAAYGSWSSPVTPELLLKGVVHMRNQMIRWDGPDLYWSELRPGEGGRIVVCRRKADGEIADVTPEGFNARSRVHEYGGGHYAVSDGIVFFTNYSDQRLYRQDAAAAPRAITPDADIRHADMVVDARRGRVIAVREDHTTGVREAVNTLVSIDASGRGDAAGRGDAFTLASGYDFYSSPKLSPDGDRLAWQAWRHPHMPWDSSEVWIAELDGGGHVTSQRKIAGGDDESVLQPEWSPGGELYFVSDRTDWWNLYRAHADGDEPVARRAAEFGAPQWVFGQRFYDFNGPDEIACVFREPSGVHLGRIDLRTGRLEEVELLYTALHSVQVSGGKAAMFASSATHADRVLVVDLETHAQEVVRTSSPARIDAGHLSVPRHVEFPTEHEKTAHAFYYPPRNQDFEAPAGEKPPLIVHVHGGPTGTAGQVYPFEFQYWTSRGFAFVDVDYGGSAGYGRAYRNRLRWEWGVVDVDDSINAARHLVEQGLADGERVSVTGGSAGGFTVLLSLTKRDFYHAGASHYGIGDLELFDGTTHKFESRYDDWLIGPYPQRKDAYHDRSAVHFADDLACPVLLLQGLEDKIVPPTQAETFVAVCEDKKLPYAYIAFAGEQHGWRRASTIRRALEVELYFLSQVFGFEVADDIEPLEIHNFPRGAPRSVGERI